MSQVNSLKKAIQFAEEYMQRHASTHTLTHAGMSIGYWRTTFVPVGKDGSINLEDPKKVEVRVFPDGKIEIPE